MAVELQRVCIEEGEPESELEPFTMEYPSPFTSYWYASAVGEQRLKEARGEVGNGSGSWRLGMALAEANCERIFSAAKLVSDPNMI